MSVQSVNTQTQQTASTLAVRYEKRGLLVDYYANLFTPDWCLYLAKVLETMVQWSRPVSAGRRSNQTYGDPGLKYEIDFPDGNSVTREARPWSELPILAEIRNYLTHLTGQTCNICVVQRYPSGRVRIKPHRDKEMTRGTLICGFSFGATRELTLTPPRYYQEEEPFNLPLEPGSLYILRPPTNDHWAHSIERDETVEPRYSLTFRTYIP